MKNPFREITQGGMMMLMLTVVTFGTYTLTSVFLLFWIPGLIPLESIFLIPGVFLIFLLWWGIQNIRFYTCLNRQLFTGWLMHYYALITFLILLISGTIFVVIRNFDYYFSIYWGQFLIAVIIAYLFAILPLPSSFKKSMKAGMYALACLVCFTSGFLLLCLAIKYIITESCNRMDFLFWESIPPSSLHIEFGWPAGIALLLLLAAYLLYAGMLSELTGAPLRKMFPKPILYLIGTAAVCHLLFFSLSLFASAQTESARHKLQDRFGRYPSAEGMNGLYFAGQKPDKAFWDYFCTFMHLDENGIRKPPDEKEVVLDQLAEYRFSELTGEEKRIYRDTMTKLSSILMKMDSRLQNNIPKYPLEMKTDKMLATELPHLNNIRVFCFRLKWRIFMALEAGNNAESFRISELIRKMSQYGEGEAFLIGALVDIACYNIYFDSLELLVEKHALTREQIQMISQELIELEKRIPQIEKNSLYSEAVCGNDIFGAVLSGYMRVLWDEPTPTIPTRSLPFFLPQLHWWLLRNQVSLLRFYDAENLESIPDVRKEKKTTSNWTAYQFTPSLRSAYIKFRQLIVRCRAERVILACELFRMDTGKYPTSASELVPKYLDKIPDDPFNGKPLLFRTGELTVEYGKIAKDYYYLQTVPKKIKGLQVWSVGQNGIDNDGIFTSKNKDDPRALIRTQ